MRAPTPSAGRQPATPDALPLAGALAGSAPLRSLSARLAGSNARLATIRPLLPPALSAHVQAGILDAEGWTLGTRNAGIAAKLRHLAPALQAALADAGLGSPPLRIKVLSA